MQSVLKKLVPAIFLSLIAASATLGQVTIQVVNDDAAGVGFNDTTPATPVGGNNGTTVGAQRLNAFQAAANIWGASLSSSQTIVVRARWLNLSAGCTPTEGVLASAGNNGLIYRDFAGALVPGHWYGIALASALSGVDRNGTTGTNSQEINAQFNLSLGTPGCLQDLSWYYGLDGNEPTFNHVDMVATTLHELGHGLGFQTFTSSSTGQQQGTAPPSPSIYDRYLFDHTTNKAWPEMTNAERVASATNTGNLVWNGPQVTADSGLLTAGKDAHGHPLMFAPNPLEGGSSVSHWDRSAFPNQLMEPNISRSLSHSVAPPLDLTLSQMKDIGWPTGTPPPPPPPPPVPGNNNFVDAFVLNGCSGSTTGTNVAANQESGEPSHDSAVDPDPGAASVWWQWTPQVSGSLTITTIGSNYDTMLGVYTGNAVNALTTIVKNDDIDPGVNRVSSVTFNATAGTVYRIAVDGWGGETGDIVLNWNHSLCNPPIGGMQFNLANYGANESQEFLTVTVTRSDSSGAATVNYASSDIAGLQNCTVANGRGSERCDYVTSVGTISFAAGQTSRTFTISLINDVHIEGTETFTVTLSNPSGGSLGSQTSATITILDNDSVATQNPIDGVEFFIRQMYRDILGRQPDSSGLQNWINTLGPCPNGGFGEPPTSNCDRLHVAAGFFQSDEFLNRGYFAFRFYMVAFNQRPTYAQFIPDMAQVGGPKSPAEEEAAKVAYANAFVQRSAFTSRYPGLSGQPLADALLQTAGLPAGSYNAGSQTNGQILRGIAESSAAFNKFLTEGTVSILYFGFQRRDPDAIGYQNNLDTLNANPSNLRHMIFIFIYSTEYRQRFGP